MIKGVGVDVAAVERFEIWSHQFDRATLTEVFTPEELAFCGAAGEPGTSYALCFVGKEATAKALGTGLRKIAWTEIEVLPEPERRLRRRPRRLRIQIRGAARERAAEIGCVRLGGACTVAGGYAVAVVLAAGSGARK